VLRAFVKISHCFLDNNAPDDILDDTPDLADVVGDVTDPADASDAADLMDAADVADADAFEELMQANLNSLSPAIIPDQQVFDEAPGQQPIEIEAGNASTASAVIIDQFPSGNPGAPLATPGDACRHETGLEESIWAPFLSQRDWAFARWAKMRGPTSTSVSELLAIPEVLLSSFLFILSLTLEYSLSTRLVFRTAP
jgi:hypothetical protein